MEKQIVFKLSRVSFSSPTFVTGLMLVKGHIEKFAGGFATPPALGESYSVYGAEVTHPQYGPQFKFTTLAALVQKKVDMKNMGPYLTQKLKGTGTGELTINTIVAATGDKLGHYLDAVADADGRSKEIVSETVSEQICQDLAEYLSKATGKSEKDIPTGKFKKHIQALFDKWKEARPQADLLSPLLGFGLSMAQAKQAVEVYGEKAVRSISEKPYDLMLTVDGISFFRADEIARRIGKIGLDSEVRIKAGLVYGLQQVTSLGEVGVKRSVLVSRTMLLVNEAVTDKATGRKSLKPGVDPLISKGRLDEVINSMLAKSQEILKPSPDDVCEFSNNLIKGLDAKGDEIIWYKVLLDSENNIATKLSQLCAPDRPDLLPYIRDVAVKPGSTLAPEQLAAVRAVFANPVSVITGGPGCGKTHVLKTVLGIAQMAGLKVELAAPTGKAAKRMREATGRMASTLHSLVGYGSARIETDLLIVDEFSMVDIDILSLALNAMNSRCRLLIVGDVDQLPSVGPGQVLRDIINSDTIPVTRLTKVFRQGAGSGIILAAQQINSGCIPESSSDGQFEVVYTDNPAQSLLEVVQKLKKSGQDMDQVQVLSPVHKGDAGCVALNKGMQQICNPMLKPKAGQTPLFLARDNGNIFCGDRVINNKNMRDVGLVNGDVGMVDTLSDNSKLSVAIFGIDKPVNLDSTTAQHLSLAYTITVHKSQGAESSVILLALDRGATFLLTRNLVYTAVTRGVDKVVVFTSESTLATAVHKGEPAEGSRRTSLRERLKEAFSQTTRRAALTAAKPVWDAPRVPAKWMPSGGLKQAAIEFAPSAADPSNLEDVPM